MVKIARYLATLYYHRQPSKKEILEQGASCKNICYASLKSVTLPDN